MIQGYFRSTGSVKRPYVNGSIHLPDMGIAGIDVRFLIDTGADRTLLGHSDARRMSRVYGVDLTQLRTGLPFQGIGGLSTKRYMVQAVLEFDVFLTNLDLAILEPVPGQPSSIPSLLGRDVLAHFALFMEERTNRILFLEPAEADRLALSP